jgi:hypothetical protein
VPTRRDRLRMNDSNSHSDVTPDAAQSRFRRTLVQVLIVQAVALTLLGLLQVLYKL